uniref:Uncharacterized protein n=1 Tax=Rhizophagus irregularis (strain DAOM 181602 / DAOM 197198 / MUCL 43194) TaxID=747089 RepID=U9TFW7_RHIID
MSKAIKVPVDIRRIPCKIETGEAHPPLSNQNQPLKIGILVRKNKLFTFYGSKIYNNQEHSSS